MVNTASVDVDFHCSACGKCCNSPPLMTIDELFAHADRFVGALSLRRIRPPHVGTRHVVDGRVVEVSEADARAFDDIARGQGFALPGGDVLILATRAIDYPSLCRCPALHDDGRCAIHASRPSTCAMVPLDAWVPDRLQPVALFHKRAGGQHDIGADCIAMTMRPGFAPLIRADRIADADFGAALARRRGDETHEKARWGEAVFRLLAPELMGRARGIDNVPFDGDWTMPLVPVLAVLAATDAGSLAQCQRFIAAQRARIAASIARALERRHAADRPMTAQLRTFDTALAALAVRLTAGR